MSDTLLCTKHLGVVCAVGGADAVDPEDFTAWLSLIDQSEGDEVRILLRTSAATPDTHQRRALFEITRDRYFRLAVLTDERAALSTMTEFEWLGHIEIRGFSYDDFEGALDFLNVADAFYPGLERKLLAMTEQLQARGSERAASGVDSYGSRDESGIEGNTPVTSVVDDMG